MVKNHLIRFNTNDKRLISPMGYNLTQNINDREDVMLYSFSTTDKREQISPMGYNLLRKH